MNSDNRRVGFPLRVAGLYGLTAGVWILLSDQLLTRLTADPRQLTFLQTYKGWGFVLATAIVLFLFVRREWSQLQDEMQARRCAEEGLRENEARLIDAQRMAGVGDFSWDVETGEVAWSEALFEMLGYDPSEVIDLARVNREIHHPEDLPQVTRWLNDCITSGRDRILPKEYRIFRKDGKELFVRTVGRIQQRPGKKPMIFATVQDVTERKRAEEEIRRNAARLAVLVDILQYPSRSLQDFLDHALDKAISLTRSRIGFIFFCDEGSGELVLNTWSQDVVRQCSVADPQTCFRGDRAGIWTEAARQRKPIVINDYQAELPGKKGCPQGHVEIRRFLSVPVIHDGRIVAVVGVANKATDYGDTDTQELTLLMDAVWKSVEAIRSEEKLRRMEWLLTPKPGSAGEKPYIPPYGDPADLNSDGLIRNAVGLGMLTDIVSDFLELLETSAAVYEKNGDYALGIFSSSWCRFLNSASRRLCGTDDNRQAMACGRWLCHESCWAEASKASIENGQPVDIECHGGLRTYAVPIRAGGGIVGSVNFGYGDPPRDPAGLKELAERFQVSEDDLRRYAAAYETRPPFIIEVAKQRLAASARLIGEIISRRQMEEALRFSEKQYRLLFETNPQPMWVYDLEMLRFLAVNRAALAHYGYSEEEFLRMTIMDIRPEEDISELLENVGGVTSGLDRAGIWRHRKKDGSIIYVEVTSHTLQFDGRRAELVLAVDISDRKQAEDALRVSEEKFRSLFQDHSAVKLIVDFDNGDIVDANRAAANFYGWPLRELRGMNIARINTLPPEKIKVAMAMARSAPNTHFEFRHRKADGTVADVEVFSSRVLIAGKEYMHSIIHDITAHRKLEEQFRQAQKMESVGRLAGGVAHDFNNMLGVILGNAEMAMDKVEPADPLRDDLEEIVTAARRSADITRQLLAFARKQTISPRVLDLNETVESMLKMLRRLIGEHIDLDWLPGSGIWSARIDPSQVDQILANLCVNARDAIDEVGRIIIETGNVRLDEAFCIDHAGFIPGDYVLLAVSDNGCGMESGTLDHVFEPFFTTKDVGRGTGLGLATVYGIVKQNNGFINVYSEPGKGTTFKIYLPRHAGGQVVPQKDEAAAIPLGHDETVLLVEDDAALLGLIRRILEELGYTVLASLAPDSAVDLAREYAGGIDLLLTDVIMPEMNGRELASRLRALHPGIGVLYMSGYTANVIAHQGVLEAGVHFIQKPFAKRDLAVSIRQVLDREREKSGPCKPAS